VTPDLTVQDVARSLNCAEKTVRSLALKGALRGYKVGHTWRFRPHALEAFKRSVDRPAAAPAAAPRVAPRRGGTLAGWHDFDYSREARS
jgi:excisionase family DNA binding protein